MGQNCSFVNGSLNRGHDVCVWSFRESPYCLKKKNVLWDLFDFVRLFAV